jgi:uncharacterized protein YjbI with pentapeptide repeats
MPPEQIHNRQLTKASDLYSLGVTIICLLTKTKSNNIGNLIDENERISFRKKLPEVSRSFVRWLEKMVERSLEKRFTDAEEALKVLNSGQISNTNGAKIFRFNPKLIKLSVGALSTLFLLMLVTYQGSKWIEQRHILAEKRQKEAEIAAEKEAEIAAEKKQKEAQKKQLVIQLQENKACIDCDLSGANLKGLFLEKMNLQRANLQGANLSGAKLKGANLSSAKLQNAQLEDAKLSDAELQNADLENANLSGAWLDSTRLKNANLKDADLQYAYLNKVDLSTSNLENANLEKAELEDANLKNANLKNANFKHTRLWGANLDGANTVGARFDGSH